MLDAVAQFLLQFAPGQLEENLVQGYQNRMALPQTQSYTVLALSGTQRIGTNVNRYAQTADEIEVMAQREYTVDVDFCDVRQGLAEEKARAVEIFGRNNLGVSFFKRLGIGLNYTDDMQYIPFVDATDQYIHRYRVVIHLTRWETVTAPQEYAERVELQRVENIDAHHKP